MPAFRGVRRSSHVSLYYQDPAREAMLAHAAAVAGATDLPVSIDLESGFGDTPEIVAETIRLAAREMRRQGTFSFADDAVDFGTLNSMF